MYRERKVTPLGSFRNYTAIGVVYDVFLFAWLQLYCLYGLMDLVSEDGL